MHTTTIVIIAVLSILFSAALACWKLQKKTPQEPNYKRRRPMNAAQQAMYWRLVKSLPDHVVLAQVAVSRCMSVKGPAFDTLSRQSLDFVICNKAMHIIAAIELEDRNDANACLHISRKIKKDALQNVGIRLLEWSTHPLPTEAYIAMEFQTQSETLICLAA